MVANKPKTNTTSAAPQPMIHGWDQPQVPAIKAAPKNTTSMIEKVMPRMESFIAVDYSA